MNLLRLSNKKADINLYKVQDDSHVIIDKTKTQHI